MTVGHGDYVFEITGIELLPDKPWRVRWKRRGGWQVKLVGCRRATEPYGESVIRRTLEEAKRTAKGWAESLAETDAYLRRGRDR